MNSKSILKGLLKFFIALVSVIILVGICAYLHIESYGISPMWYFEQLLSQEEKEEINFDDYIIVEEDVDYEKRMIFEHLINKVPAYILEDFKKDGWNLYLTNKNLAELTGIIVSDENFVAGLCVSETQAIIINYTSLKTIIHEFGHYLDFKYNYISDSEEFVAIFNEEKTKFVDNVKESKENLATPSEYFATTFSYYNNNPKKLKNCPKTKAFIEKYFVYN